MASWLATCGKKHSVLFFLVSALIAETKKRKQNRFCVLLCFLCFSPGLLVSACLASFLCFQETKGVISSTGNKLIYTHIYVCIYINQAKRV